LPTPDSPVSSTVASLGRRRALGHEADAGVGLGRDGAQAQRRALRRRGLQRALDAHEQFLDRERLGEEVGGAEAHRLDGGFDAAVGGHQDHRRVGRERTDARERREAVEAGHAQVEHGEVEGRLLPGRQGRCARCDRDDLAAQPPQAAVEEVAHALLVVGDEDAGGERPLRVGCHRRIVRQGPRSPQVPPPGTTVSHR
jgi:hypothetical protein